MATGAEIIGDRQILGRPCGEKIELNSRLGRQSIQGKAMSAARRARKIETRKGDTTGHYGGGPREDIRIQ